MWGDMPIIVEVAGDKRQMMVQSRCSNQQIIIVFGIDEVFPLGSCSKLAANNGKVSRDRTGDTKYRRGLQKQAPPLFMLLTVLPVIDTFVHFGKRDNAHSQPLWEQYSFRKGVIC
jgi:hypothetical protein